MIEECLCFSFGVSKDMNFGVSIDILMFINLLVVKEGLLNVKINGWF